MFTGIVQAVGRIVRLEPLEIECGGLDLSDVAIGDSIAVQGVCLTVTTLTGKGFTADVSVETRRVTTGLDRAGGAVNLEKSLALGERLGGHLVAGHVDGVGEVIAFKDGVLRVRSPRELARYIARKGSVCIDGVSLTVVAPRGREFHVALIPETLRRTTLGSARAGTRVHLEADQIGKWIERLLEARR